MTEQTKQSRLSPASPNLQQPPEARREEPRIEGDTVVVLNHIPHLRTIALPDPPGKQDEKMMWPPTRTLQIPAGHLDRSTFSTVPGESKPILRSDWDALCADKTNSARYLITKGKLTLKPQL